MNIPEREYRQQLSKDIEHKSLAQLSEEERQRFKDNWAAGHEIEPVFKELDEVVTNA